MLEWDPEVVQPRQTSLHEYKLALGENDTTSIGFGSHTSMAKIKRSRYYYIRLCLPIIIPIEVKHSMLVFFIQALTFKPSSYLILRIHESFFPDFFVFY
jgi:hypothetical protein